MPSVHSGVVTWPIDTQRLAKILARAIPVAASNLSAPWFHPPLMELDELRDVVAVHSRHSHRMYEHCQIRTKLGSLQTPVVPEENVHEQS